MRRVQSLGACSVWNLALDGAWNCSVNALVFHRVVDAQEVVQRHIKLLHQYNELKDIATGLFGMIAERRGTRVKDIYEDFGVEEDD